MQPSFPLILVAPFGSDQWERRDGLGARSQEDCPTGGTRGCGPSGKWCHFYWVFNFLKVRGLAYSSKLKIDT